MTQPFVPLQGVDVEHRTAIATAVNQLLQGRSNNVGEVTLTPSAATTTVIDNRFNSDMAVLLVPLTASAAAAIPTTYLSGRDHGKFTLTHASASSTDRAFLYVRWG